MSTSGGGYLPLQPAAASNYAKLQSWFMALANRQNAQANIILHGGSIAEGYPVTSYDRTIGQHLARLLRQRFPTVGVTGGRGYIGVPATAQPWPLVFTGGGPDDAVFCMGAKHRIWIWSAAGKVVNTLTGPVSSFDINHILSGGGGATTAYYKIDGGASVPFNTLAGVGTLSKFHVASPAAATIEVGWNAAGSIFFEGMTEYNGDELGGITVHDCGHSGFSAAQWLLSTANPSAAASMANLNPNLLIMHDFGINDAISTNGNLTAAQFKVSLQTWIAALRAAGVTCPILLVADYDVTAGILAVPATWRDGAWTPYVSVLQAVAQADPTIAYLDHGQRMPPTGTAGTGGLYAGDLTHGNADGNAYLWIAETLAAAISPY